MALILDGEGQIFENDAVIVAGPDGEPAVRIIGGDITFRNLAGSEVDGGSSGTFVVEASGASILNDAGATVSASGGLLLSSGMNGVRFENRGRREGDLLLGDGEDIVFEGGTLPVRLVEGDALGEGVEDSAASFNDIAAGGGNDEVVVDLTMLGFDFGGSTLTPTGPFLSVDGGAGEDSLTLIVDSAADGSVLSLSGFETLVIEPSAPGASTEFLLTALGGATSLVIATDVILSDVNGAGAEAILRDGFLLIDENSRIGAVMGEGLIGDFVINQGRIEGDVDLGAGSDYYGAFFDGSAGGTISGGGGSDMLVGLVAGDAPLPITPVDDVFSGGAGDDVLWGGLGSDTLSGGSGRDIFYFDAAGESPTSASDVITDFETGVDIIDLEMVVENLTITEVGGETRISGTEIVQTAGGEERVDFTIISSRSVIRSDIFTAGVDIVAVDDEAVALVLFENNLQVLSNDLFDNQAQPPLTIEIVEGPLSGTARVGSFGTIVYTPDPAQGTAGTENATITYRLRDANGVVSNEAVVRIDNVVPQVAERSGGTLRGTDSSDGLVGNVSADVLIGLGGNDIIDGGDGNDLLRPGLGADRLTLGGGRDTVSGTLEELAGDEISDLLEGDTLVVEGAALRSEDVLETGGPFVLFSGPNGDSFELGLGRDLGTELIFAGQLTGDTSIASVFHLVDLAEGRSVFSSDVNGVAVPLYLNGDTSDRFEVTLQPADAAADYSNSLGVYEVRADGTIADVRLLTANVKDGGTFTVEEVEQGSTLGFFIVQDGAAIAELGGLDGTLGMEVSGGTAFLTEDGARVNNATIFLSHNSSLNPDNAVHVLSGASENGSASLLLGFEDTGRSGPASDNDFQDVVFQVEALPPEPPLI